MSRALLALHIALAVNTGLLFLFRAWRIFTGKALSRLWRRYIPDINDVLLLASGALLVFVRGHSFAEPWLSVKLGCVVGYILLGILALRRRNGFAFALALVLYAYILLLALTKQIWIG